MSRSTGSLVDLSSSDARWETGAAPVTDAPSELLSPTSDNAIVPWHARYQGKEVIARPLGFFFREFERLGLSTDLLMADISLTREELTSRHGRIDWDTMRIMMRNVGRVWDDEELIDAGKRLNSSAWIRPFALVARLLFSADELYRWNTFASSC